MVHFATTHYKNSLFCYFFDDVIINLFSARIIKAIVKVLILYYREQDTCENVPYELKKNVDRGMNFAFISIIII